MTIYKLDAENVNVNFTYEEPPEEVSTNIQTLTNSAVPPLDLSGKRRRDEIYDAIIESGYFWLGVIIIVIVIFVFITSLFIICYMKLKKERNRRKPEENPITSRPLPPVPGSAPYEVISRNNEYVPMVMPSSTSGGSYESADTEYEYLPEPNNLYVRRQANPNVYEEHQ